MRLAIAALALSACANLAEVSSEAVCGNYTLDVQEDCDAGPAGSTWCTPQCQLRCQPQGCVDRDGNALANYRCGIDGLCHAPGGDFPRETGQFPFTPIAVATSDINNDGIPDLVGLSLDTEVVRFGDPEGTLQRETVTLVPSTSGQSTFGDLDGDGNADAIVPTPDGLAVMTSSSSLPLPYPFANSVSATATCLDGTQPRGVVVIDDHHMLIVVAQSQRLFATVLDLNNGTCSEALVSACGIPDGASLRDVAVVGYDTSAVTAPDTSAVVAISQGSKLCTLTAVLPASGPVQLTAGAAMTRSLVAGSQPVFAQVDGAVPACPDLFAGDGTGTWRYSATGGASGCSVATTASVLPAVLGGGPRVVPTGHAHVAPQIANAGPDVLALTDLAGFGGNSTIYAFVTPPAMATSAVPLFQGMTGFTSMESADLDGNGVTEIVATSQLSSDVQIFYRTQNPDGFLLDRVPTEGTPVAVVLRDYDANGLPDIAFVETLAAETRIDIAYSTPDRPLPPVPMASFPSDVFAVTPTQLMDSIDPQQKAEDLAVVRGLPGATPGTFMPVLTELHGSAQRSMFAFFDPRDPFATNKHAFVAAVAGYFFSPAPQPPTVTPQDLITFEDVSDVSGFAFGWLLDHETAGVLGTSRGRAIVRGLDNTLACTTAGATVCAATASYTTARIAGNRDVVIAVDGHHHLSVLDPQGAVPAFVDSGAIAAMPNAPGPEFFVYRPSTADLDGDGAPELVLPFRLNNYDNTASAQLVVCHLDPATGVPQMCQNLTADGGPLAKYQCADAGAGRLTARGRAETYGDAVALDLAAACIDPGGVPAVAILRNNAGSLELEKTLPIAAIYLAVADVTGDGVDDLLLLEPGDSRSAPAIHVLPQCEARTCGQ
jgi:hypothetical protein